MNPCRDHEQSPVPGLAGMFCDLATQSFRLGSAVFDAFRTAAQEGFHSLGGLSRLSGCVPRGAGCEIPPPCWLPKSLGEVRSAVCPGAKATLRLIVTNCGISPRAFRVEPGEAGSIEIAIVPDTVLVRPQERATFVITAEVPPDTPCSNRKEWLVWLLGCHDYYVRWTVIAAESGDCSCHEIRVEDCPDLVHHWYDHFYCDHPCPSKSRTVGH